MSHGLRWWALSALAASGLLATASPSAAQEIRVGVGYTAQSIVYPGSHGTERGSSVNAEYLFKPITALHFIGSPRPFVGVSASLNGFTDFASIGLLWRVERGRFYADLGAGGAVHNGELFLPPPMVGLPLEENLRRREIREERSEFGYRELYHAMFDVGWRLNDRWAVELLGQHWSNAHLGTSSNDGADILSARLAFRL
ncbi:MAG TPA: acyloxyacyl hydrolase [Phenylobacterium sp.]|jgi:hypothetical protein